MHTKPSNKPNPSCLFIVLMMMLVTGAPVSADELLMKDGSRLLGTVVNKENGTLEFKTTFAGVIKVQWAEVSELHADEPVTVMRANDETSTATVIKNTEQATLLDSGDSNNLTINSWTGFRFPLYMGIVASTEAEIEYDGGAPDDVDKTDKTCRVKLGYQW